MLSGQREELVSDSDIGVRKAVRKQVKHDKQSKQGTSVVAGTIYRRSELGSEDN